MVGSLGECLVADAYDLELMTASNKGYDTVTASGVEVDINATQSNSVAFRSQPQHTIIIKILRDATFEEIYNGPGALVWEQFKDKRLPSKGQFQISLHKFRQLKQTVAQADCVGKNRDADFVKPLVPTLRARARKLTRHCNHHNQAALACATDGAGQHRD